VLENKGRVHTFVLYATPTERYLGYWNPKRVNPLCITFAWRTWIIRKARKSESLSLKLRQGFYFVHFLNSLIC